VSMILHVYLYRDTFYIPTVGVIGPGFYEELDPVDAVRQPSVDELSDALERAVGRGNPSVPLTPQRPNPVIVRATRAGSWRALERRARSWTVRLEKRRIAIEPDRRSRTGGFEPDEDTFEYLPRGGGLSSLASRLIALADDPGASPSRQ